MMGTILTPNCTANGLAIMRPVKSIVHTGDQDKQVSEEVQDLVGCDGSRSVRLPSGEWVCLMKSGTHFDDVYDMRELLMEVEESGRASRFCGCRCGDQAVP